MITKNSLTYIDFVSFIKENNIEFISFDSKYYYSFIYYPILEKLTTLKSNRAIVDISNIDNKYFYDVIKNIIESILEKNKSSHIKFPEGFAKKNSKDFNIYYFFSDKEMKNREKDYIGNADYLELRFKFKNEEKENLSNQYINLLENEIKKIREERTLPFIIKKDKRLKRNKDNKGDTFIRIESICKDKKFFSNILNSLKYEESLESPFVNIIWQSLMDTEIIELLNKKEFMKISIKETFN